MTTRNELLSELKQTKDALIAAKKRKEKATNRLKVVEDALAPVLEKMRKWVKLPVAEDSIARCLTTAECRAIVAALADDEEETEE